MRGVWSGKSSRGRRPFGFVKTAVWGIGDAWEVKNPYKDRKPRELHPGDKGQKSFLNFSDFGEMSREQWNHQDGSVICPRSKDTRDMEDIPSDNLT